jgi:predicted nucleic acid-binding protein
MFLLDSNIIYELFKGNTKVSTRLTLMPEDLICTCAPVLTEFYGGIENCTIDSLKIKLLFFYESFLHDIKVFPFDNRSITVFAREKNLTQKMGKKISDIDLQTSAIALSNHCILVTDREKVFELIDGLKTEKWL